MATALRSLSAGRIVAGIAVTFVLAVCFVCAPARADDARAIVQASLDWTGGATRLHAIHAIEYTAVGERQMIEQSERPTGPYFIDHFIERAVRDIVGDRERIVATHEGYAADQWWTTEQPQTVTLVVNRNAGAVEASGTLQYADGAGVTQNDDLQRFSPERLLLTALSAPDLRSLPDETLHGVLHHVVAFTTDGIACVLKIGAETHVPWQVAYTRPYPYQVFLNPWGDVTTTITFNAWTLEPNGVRFPREWTYERMGLPDEQLSIVDLHFNPALDEGALTIPPATLAAHSSPQPIDDYPLGYGGSDKPHELAPGILEVPGGWNVAFVRQNDGVVMIEAPWSTGYTKRALALARAT